MTSALQRQLAQEIASYSLDPLGFVRFALPWGKAGTPLENMSGPRQWQAEVLGEIGERLRTAKDTHELGKAITPVRKAISAGNGIGKSALIGFITAWSMSTCEKTKLRVSANTATQLESTTWAEISKWFGLLINRHWFDIQATTIRVKGHEREWFAEAKTWSEKNLEAFAGLHNFGKRVVMIFDEASGFADGVWQFAEPVLTDADTEIVWLVVGNPTQTGNRFQHCFGSHRHLWSPQTIDARTVEGTNRALYQEWIDSYGEDSDYVRVHVKGQFPRAGSTQFIGTEIVTEATQREPGAIMTDVFVMGVDVARFGDDQSVIVFRKGRDARMIPPIKLRNVDTMQLAARVADEAARYKADAVFVDGGGVGGGVVDRLRQLRVPGVVDVQFGAKADRANFDAEPARYANKRAEMWGNMREWLSVAGIPNDPELIADLTGVQFGHNARDEIQLERKEDMKKRGLASPDVADALALTFAYPVAPSTYAGGPHMIVAQQRKVYDPHG